MSELFLLEYADEVFLKNEQDGEAVMLRDEETCSGKCWTDGEWENHLLLEEPIGGMLTAKLHVFSGSVFCIGPGALDPTSASTFLEKKAEAIIKSDY